MCEPEPVTTNQPLLIVDGLTKLFPARHRLFRPLSPPVVAVDRVSFSVDRGQSCGIVGESGCGKTTLTRAILRLTEPTSGRVVFDNVELGALGRQELQAMRRRMQLVFQDPFGSLDPRMSVVDIVAEGLDVHGTGERGWRRERAGDTLKLVGIPPALHGRRPPALSGGQRQRVSVARALVMQPDLVVLDEPLSALDVSIQAQVLNLLQELQSELGLTYVFVVHDLAVAEYFCDRIAVLYRGAVVEEGTRAQLFGNPLHPYSVALISLAPRTGKGRARERRQIVLQGDVTPHQVDGAGCRFRARCPVGRELQLCKEKEPVLAERQDGQRVACHFPGELRLSTESEQLGVS
jgi:oligopeptide/dipeptide ABC transporter ATP-binding protein